jgi:hypothetical protein
MSDLQRRPEPTCWDCGAANDPGASECWLCLRKDWNQTPDIRWIDQGRDHPRRNPMSTIGGWMVLIAVIGVAIGFFREAPGLTIILMISVVPALFFTELKARKRQSRGEPMSGWERAFWLLGLTILIPILTVVALVVALFTYCAFLAR